MSAKMSGVSGVRWLIVNGEPVAHAIVSDDPSSRGWRPLCQQSDIGNLLLRDARDGIDEFCGSCCTVYGSRMRLQQRRSRHVRKGNAMITPPRWPHALPYGDPRHGTLNGYINLGCRCPDCQTAHAQAQRQARKVRAARLVADPSLATHGKANTYLNWACHCRPCTEAKSAVDTIGRRRRATP